MPGNANTFLIGTACGGVWKTINGGLNWTVLNTDNLPSLSIASIAIDPIDTNNIYIATGDNFAGIPNFLKPYKDILVPEFLSQLMVASPGIQQECHFNKQIYFILNS